MLNAGGATLVVEAPGRNRGRSGSKAKQRMSKQDSSSSTDESRPVRPTLRITV